MFPCVKCSLDAKLRSESWSISPGTEVTVIVAPLLVTPIPLVPSILKSALPEVSEAGEPEPLSVIILIPVKSPLCMLTHVGEFTLVEVFTYTTLSPVS